MPKPYNIAYALIDVEFCFLHWAIHENASVPEKNMPEWDVWMNSRLIEVLFCVYHFISIYDTSMWFAHIQFECIAMQKGRIGIWRCYTLLRAHK